MEGLVVLLVPKAQNAWAHHVPATAVVVAGQLASSDDDEAAEEELVVHMLLVQQVHVQGDDPLVATDQLATNEEVEAEELVVQLATSEWSLGCSSCIPSPEEVALPTMPSSLSCTAGYALAIKGRNEGSLLSHGWSLEPFEMAAAFFV